MREYFEEQINNNRRATEKDLKETDNKNFYSGRRIEAGDLVLFAMLNDGNGNLKLISLHEEEIDNYEPARDVTHTFMPSIKPKQI